MNCSSEKKKVLSRKGYEMDMTVIFAIINTVLYGTVYSSTCIQFNLSKDYFDVALYGHSLLEINDTKRHECAQYCVSVTVCKSFDYDKERKICKLNDVDRSSVDLTEFESKQGSVFSDISEWPNTMGGTCYSKPCQANQRCHQMGDSHVCMNITCITSQHIEGGTIEVNALEEDKFLDKASVRCDIGFGPRQLEVECQALGQWEPTTCKRLSDCKEILDKFPEAKSGTYEIELWNSGTILTVNCDMETEGGGWTIFQRRIDGSVDFYRNFTEYENGFGKADGELWLGLKFMQELAEQGDTDIRLDLTDSNNHTGYEACQNFNLINGIEYTLSFGSCTASAVTVTNGFQYHNLGHFSSYDRDVDTTSRNCAQDRHGGWWHKYCGYVNLNGLYVTPGTRCELEGAETGGCGLTHVGFDGTNGLRSSSMMLRRN